MLIVGICIFRYVNPPFRFEHRRTNGTLSITLVLEFLLDEIIVCIVLLFEVDVVRTYL